MNRVPLFVRSKRLVTVAAVVTATVVAGGVLRMASADVSAGDRGVFVPIVPCRLFDTRFDATVGVRHTPLGPGDTLVQEVYGTNGDCTIPTDATAIALNVTIVNPTADSFLTVSPSDATRPLASNLNWRRGDAPTPNKVDVKLAANGRVSFFNSAGSVDLLADAVGYYANHNHDDRYYTKAQEDAAFGVKANKPTGASQFVVDSSAFSLDIDTNADTTGFAHDYIDGAIVNIGSGQVCGGATLVLPSGVTVTSLVASVQDNNASAAVTVSLYRNPRGSAGNITTGLVQTGVGATPGNTTLTDPTITDAVIDNTQNGYLIAVCGLTNSTRMYDVTITFTYP